MSKSLRNVLTSIALIQQMVQSLDKNYRDRPKNKSVMKLTKKALASFEEALSAWPGQIDSKGMAKIRVRVGKFEKLYGETPDFVFFSSVALGILSDILRNIRDQYRRSVIIDLISAMRQIHRYFDRDLNKLDVYRQATRAVNVWHTLGEV